MGHRHPFERVVLAVGSPYGALLLVLMAMLLVYPFLGSHGAFSWVLDFVTLGLVVASLRVIHGRGGTYYLSLLLGLSAFLAGLLGRSMDVASAYPVGAGLRALFMAFLIVVIFSDIMRRRDITFDAVLGACSVFVLLGLAFGSAYALLEWLVPGSFAIPVVPPSIASVFGHTSTEFSLLYFSLVTMSTVGFGDIVPVAAPADLYPRFGLSGTFGLQSRSLSNLFDSSSVTWGLGAPVQWNIFSGGRVRGNIQVQDEKTQQLLYLYENKVLAAIEEVENAIMAFDLNQVRVQYLQAATSATREAVELVLVQYDTGLTDFNNVLVTQRDLFSQQDQLVASEAEVIVNLITLYKALGGGWDLDDATNLPAGSMPVQESPS